MHQQLETYESWKKKWKNKKRGRFWRKEPVEINIGKLFGLTAKSGKIRNIASFWQKKWEKQRVEVLKNDQKKMGNCVHQH